MWLVFTPAPFLIAKIGQIVGAPISNVTILVATVLFAVLFLLPAVRGWGLRVAYANWNRAGLSWRWAISLRPPMRTTRRSGGSSSSPRKRTCRSKPIGALPLPPSLWHWDGLVRAPRGVYEMRMDLSEGLFQKTHQAPAIPIPT